MENIQVLNIEHFGPYLRGPGRDSVAGRDIGAGRAELGWGSYPSRDDNYFVVVRA